jgi:putative peptidoglycan lipid II flippase
MSEHAVKGESQEVGIRMREGLRLLLFLLVPIAGFLLVAARPLLELGLNNGAMTVDGTDLIARTLAAFAIGLPTYSIYLVLTRAFYALSDTKTPALINMITVVVSSVGGAVAFFAAPEGWEVPALAAAHSVASVLGAVLLSRVLRTRVGAGGGAALRDAALRVCGIGALATAAMAAAAAETPDAGKGGSAVAIAAIAVVGSAVYLGLMRWLRSDELASLRAVIGRGRA